MKGKYKEKFTRVFIGVLFLPFVIGFSVSELSDSLIPEWAQKSKFSCFPSDLAIEPTSAFLYGLKGEIKRDK